MEAKDDLELTPELVYQLSAIYYTKYRKQFELLTDPKFPVSVTLGIVGKTFIEDNQLTKYNQNEIVGALKTFCKDSGSVSLALYDDIMESNPRRPIMNIGHVIINHIANTVLKEHIDNLEKTK